MQFQAQPHLAGKTVACPSCGGRLTVPAASASPARSTPAPNRAAPGPAVSAPVAAPQIVACQCGAKFQADANLAGKTVRCPTCQRPLRIPVAGRAVPPALVSAPAQPADGFWDALLPEKAKPVVEEPPEPEVEETLTGPQATAFAIQQLSRGTSPGVVRKELVERGVSDAEASRVIETLAPKAKTALPASGGKGAGLQNMLIGGVVCFIGLAVTVGSYVAAEPGGVFLLAYGPIIFGGIQFIRGFFQLCVGSD